MNLSQAPDLGRYEALLIRLFDTGPDGVLAVLAVVAAIGIGAAHGLAPGHAKTITAAYLIGERARVRDALAIGGIVALMHTGSVLALGLALYGATGGSVPPDRVTPWMTIAAGVVVIALGIGLLVRRARERSVAHDTHQPGPRELGHPHPHSHRHRPPTGLPEGVSPLSVRGVAIIGLAGGLIPSPSAFLVVATALFLDRLLYGLALVAGFSVGLAATITAVGVLAVKGRKLVADRRSSGILSTVERWLPTAAALVVVAGGIWLTSLGMSRLS